MSMAMVTACSSSSSCSSFTRNTHLLLKVPFSPSPTLTHQHRTPTSFNLKCQAARDNTLLEPPTVYQGVYGPWSVDSADIREVVLYRSGLVTAATSFVVAVMGINYEREVTCRYS
ncbi:hypothetical protein HanHA300_Chr06g0209001 [Helianthus annuus]|nr:hypothetical protein HanHA300_Chr06g0209001 [Helianthus annuus]